MFVGKKFVKDVGLIVGVCDVRVEFDKFWLFFFYSKYFVNEYFSKKSYEFFEVCKKFFCMGISVDDILVDI